MAGGGMLVIKPDGSLLGMDPTWLEQAPFDSYIIPGLVLFTVIGLFSVLILVGLIARPSWSWANSLNIYPHRHWAWTYSLYSGVVLILWIVAQQLLTRYFWLQPVMILTGVLIIVFTLTPTVTKKLETPAQPGKV